MRVVRSVVLVSGLVLLSPAVGRAADKAACLDAHLEAQALRKQGRLKEARARLSVCADEACPSLVRKDCTPWLEELNAEQPSVAVSARDTGGHDTMAVRVLVDGSLLAEKLDGRPLEVDPGAHKFRFELAAGEAREEDVVVHAREKARVLAVDFSPPKPAEPPSPPAATTAPSSEPPAPERSRSIPPAAFIVGGVGALALGSFAYFGLSGKARESSLASSCAPTCSQSAADHLRLTYLAADISLAVGVVSLGVAAAIVIAGSWRDAPTKSSWLDVAPVPGGGVARVGSVF